MSAFVVSPRHIDAMVSLAVTGPVRSEYNPNMTVRWLSEPMPEWDGDMQAHQQAWQERRRDPSTYGTSELGAMLLTECIRSVASRYPDSALDELPGPIPTPNPDDYRYRPLTHAQRPTAVEGLKLLQCYEYQSCEHDGWATSEAKRFCDALQAVLIDSLPGMSEAPWEWTRSPVAS